MNSLALGDLEPGLWHVEADVVEQESMQEQLTIMGSDTKHVIALEQGGCRASVVLRVDCTADDVLYAYVHAYVVLHAKQPLVGFSCACYTRTPSISTRSMKCYIDSIACLGAYSSCGIFVAQPAGPVLHHMGC